MFSIDKSRTWKLTVVLILVALVVVNLCLDDTFNESNNSWVEEAQDDGGETLRWISITFSTVFVFWVFLFLFLYLIFNADVIFFLYIFTVFFLSILITYILKAIYYSDRPFVLSENFRTECACDPGMPSGHSTTAAAAFIILFLVIYRHHIVYQRNTDRLINGLILFCFCLTVVVFVMLAMIYLGVHTYMQTIVGAWIAVTVVSLITFEVWLRIMNALKGVLLVSLVIFSILLICFTIMMMLINSYLRDDDADRPFFDQQCPACNKTWVYGQTRTLAFILFFPVFLLFFPYGDINGALTPRGYTHRSMSSLENPAIQPSAVAIEPIQPGRLSPVPQELPLALGATGLVQRPSIGPLNQGLRTTISPIQPGRLSPVPPYRISRQPMPIEMNNLVYREPLQAQVRSEVYSAEYNQTIPAIVQRPLSPEERAYREIHEYRYSEHLSPASRLSNPPPRAIPEGNLQIEPIPIPPPGHAGVQYEWRPDHRMLTYGQQMRRLLWPFLLILPAIVLVTIYFFWIEDDYVLDSDMSNQEQALIAFFVYGIIAIYVGWALTWWRDRVYFDNDLLTYNDRLYYEDLKRRLDMPEIIRRPSSIHGTSSIVRH